MSMEEINAVKDALAKAGFTGLHVHITEGVATLNGPLPFDNEAMLALTQAWPDNELSQASS